MTAPCAKRLIGAQQFRLTGPKARVPNPFHEPMPAMAEVAKRSAL